MQILRDVSVLRVTVYDYTVLASSTIKDAVLLANAKDVLTIRTIKKLWLS